MIQQAAELFANCKKNNGSFQFFRVCKKYQVLPVRWIIYGLFVCAEKSSNEEVAGKDYSRNTRPSQVKPTPLRTRLQLFLIK